MIHITRNTDRISQNTDNEKKKSGHETIISRMIP